MLISFVVVVELVLLVISIFCILLGEKSRASRGSA